MRRLSVLILFLVMALRRVNGSTFNSLTITSVCASQGAPTWEDKAPVDPEPGEMKLSEGTFPGPSALSLSGLRGCICCCISSSSLCTSTDTCTDFHYVHHSEGGAFNGCSILPSPSFRSWNIHRSAPSQTQFAVQLQQLVHLLLLYECLWIRCECAPMRM